MIQSGAPGTSRRSGSDYPAAGGIVRTPANGVGEEFITQS
jgi:hypothetical protein